MRIKNTESNQQEIIDDMVMDVEAEEMEEDDDVDIADIQDDEESPYANISVTEFETESGRSAIRFVSPLSKKKIEILKPTSLDLINIERDVTRNHKNAGNFEQIVVSLAKLIVCYGDRVGVECMPFKRLVNLEPSEIMLMNIMSQKFFRLG